MPLKKAKKKIKKLETKQSYNDYQEKLGLEKELTILRNDFYYQMTSLSSESVYLIDFLYKPLDTMSGDAYTARKIDDFRTFYFIIDGMGKGLSASLTAMIMASFTNHIIDKMIEHDHFDLYLLVFETLHYIQKVLLEEEVLAMDYIIIDDERATLDYAKFAMPVSLMQNSKDEIIRLKSNNPPISKYQNDFKISSHDIGDIDKFLFYSDGIVENATIYDERTYADFIEEDFKHSFTRQELVDNIFSKITEQEDDLTLAFITRMRFNDSTHVETKTFGTSLDEVEEANKWYIELIDNICTSQTIKDAAPIVFSELFMNAYEHGNLGIKANTKHKLIEGDIYFQTLGEKEQNCSKKITVT
ncbi:MAG: PP2C family protein-serine/threonine phosphatase, partial [Sulfurimonas sp.]